MKLRLISRPHNAFVRSVIFVDGIIYGGAEENVHLPGSVPSAVLLPEGYLRTRIRLRAFFGIYFSCDETGNAVPYTFASNDR